MWSAVFGQDSTGTLCPFQQHITTVRHDGNFMFCVGVARETSMCRERAISDEKSGLEKRYRVTNLSLLWLCVVHLIIFLCQCWCLPLQENSEDQETKHHPSESPRVHKSPYPFADNALDEQDVRAALILTRMPLGSSKINPSLPRTWTPVAKHGLLMHAGSRNF